MFQKKRSERPIKTRGSQTSKSNLKIKLKSTKARLRQKVARLVWAVAIRRLYVLWLHGFRHSDREVTAVGSFTALRAYGLYHALFWVRGLPRPLSSCATYRIRRPRRSATVPTAKAENILLPGAGRTGCAGVPRLIRSMSTRPSAVDSAPRRRNPRGSVLPCGWGRHWW